MNGRKKSSALVTICMFMLVSALAGAAASAKTIYVNDNASGVNNGTSWSNAYRTLQSALSAAGYDDEIWVAAGTYKPTSGTDRNASFQMKHRVAIYGGFPDTGSPGMGERDWKKHETVLSGDIGARGDNKDNCYHVFYHPRSVQFLSSAVLDGFTVTGGNANGDDYPQSNGGGMFNEFNSSPLIRNCTFTENSADVVGGAMCVYSSCPTLVNCAFTNNDAGVGAGLFIGPFGKAVVQNCVFAGNSGVGISNLSGDWLRAINCTFFGNSGSAIYTGDSATTVTNCICRGNSGGEVEGSGNYVTYCNIQGGYSGEGNIDADPLFVDAGGGDFHLKPASPCIGAGNNNASYLPDQDIDGNPRIFGGAVDIGADEWTSIIYVNASGGGIQTGRCWREAYSDLQAGLNEATVGYEIWVGAGTYRPTKRTRASDPRTATFSTRNGVSIYGGFPADGRPEWSDRDPQVHKTILSGDIGDPDYGYDNAYHVVYGSGVGGTAILDGVYVRDGLADGDAPFEGHGAGMYCMAASLRIQNCHFVGNTAIAVGGGIFAMGCPGLTITGCTFSNQSMSAGGGLGTLSSSVTVDSCQFLGNYAHLAGGAMASNGNDTITNCTFAGNVSLGPSGGAMVIESGAATVTNCTFYANQAGYPSGQGYGGAMFVENCSPKVTNCILWNDAPDEIYGGTPVVTYSDVKRSSGTYPGTGNMNSDPLFVNAAADDFHLLLGSPCINAGSNSAPKLPEADFDGEPRVLDGRADMGADEANVNTLSTSVIPVTAGTITLDPPGGFYADPVLVTVTGEAAEGYAFDHWSGDLSGNTNPATILVDSPKNVTAHFKLSGSTIYVNDDADGLNNGGCWLNAFTDLQNALDMATAGTQIWVAQGTYKPTVEHGGTGSVYKSFQMKDGVSIYGGFPNAGNPNLSYRNPGAYETILSGDIGVEGLPDDNCHHVLYNLWLDSTAVLDGFTVTGGSSDSEGGGGMWNDQSSPTVVNCVFRGNSGSFGGGMWNLASSCPTLSNCIFYDNSATGSGGGLANSGDSSAIITNCTFYGNTATDFGGGLYNEGLSTPTVINCILWANSAAIEGEQIYSLPDSPPTVTCSDVEGGYAGTGNIDSDPCFVDASAGNLRLSSDSPCIDVGDSNAPNLLLTDLEGRPRIIDGDCDEAALVDMGAYEFNYGRIGDLDYDCGVDFADFSVFAPAWMAKQGEENYSPATNMGVPADALIDWLDFRVIAENWLATPE